MYTYTLDYLFNDQPRTHHLELKQAELPVHDAAMHLLELHFGDGENSLTMPNADATPDEVLQQAERVGLRRIKVTARAGDSDRPA